MLEASDFETHSHHSESPDNVKSALKAGICLKPQYEPLYDWLVKDLWKLWVAAAGTEAADMSGTVQPALGTASTDRFGGTCYLLSLTLDIH